MSLYDRGEPAANQRFRANTEKSFRMLNVTQVPKRVKCYCCEKLRTEATGQHTDVGFLCGMCGGRK